MLRQRRKRHQGHVTHIAERDHRLLDDADDGLAIIAEADEIASSIAGLARSGVSEAIYTPSGRDIARELETFYAAAARYVRMCSVMLA